MFHIVYLRPCLQLLSHRQTASGLLCDVHVYLWACSLPLRLSLALSLFLPVLFYHFDVFFFFFPLPLALKSSGMVVVVMIDLCCFLFFVFWSFSLSSPVFNALAQWFMGREATGDLPGSINAQRSGPLGFKCRDLRYHRTTLSFRHMLIYVSAAGSRLYTNKHKQEKNA